MNDILKPAPAGLHGLQKVCRMHGRMKIQGVTHFWDYANEEAVPASEMPIRSKRWMASEKAKWIRPNDEVSHER